VRKTPKIPEEAMKYFRLTGSIGGKARAEQHSPEQLSEWGKMGGRPKGSGKKTAQVKPTPRKGAR
jgi:hypothetical protein